MKIHRHYCDICKTRIKGGKPTGTIKTTASGELGATDELSFGDVCLACVRAVNETIEARLKNPPSHDKEWRT